MSSQTMEIIFGLMGGLALFIYGMNLMGDGLKKLGSLPKSSPSLSGVRIQVLKEDWFTWTTEC